MIVEGGMSDTLLRQLNKKWPKPAAQASAWPKNVEDRKPVIRASSTLHGETHVDPQGFLVAGFVMPAHWIIHHLPMCMDIKTRKPDFDFGDWVKNHRISALGLGGLAVIIFAVVATGQTMPATSNNLPPPTENAGSGNISATTGVAPVAYMIASSQDESIKATGDLSFSDLSVLSTQELMNLPIDKRMTYRIVVPPTITAVEVKSTVDKIISDITTKNPDIDEIILAFYSDKSIANGAYPYDVAMATWAPADGGVTPEIATSNDRSSYQTVIQITPNLAQYLQERNNPQTKYGLSITERQQIYKANDANETSAMTEADQQYPLSPNHSMIINSMIVKQNADLDNQLLKQYTVSLLARYSITQDVLDSIVYEGVQMNWPTQ